MTHQTIRILVVDDEITARLLMRTALEKTGFEVSLAENGAAALTQFQAQPCDLVMLDVDMPGLNGFQVYAQLRADFGDELPIVMVTGMDDLESIERAFGIGATDFIFKPINWALIGHRVRYLLRGFMVLQDLHTANARNSAILNAMPDTLLRVDASGQVLEVRSMGRAHASQFLSKPGSPLTQNLPAELAGQVLDLVARAQVTGAAENMDIKPVESDGEVGYYDVRLAMITCETLQGYYISQPVPAIDIPTSLARHWSIGEGCEQNRFGIQLGLAFYATGSPWSNSSQS